MDAEKDNYVAEWRIENFSLWCMEVHGAYIQCPGMRPPYYYMQLYPKGVDGKGERLVLRFRGNHEYPFSCEISIRSSDGYLLCSKQQVAGVQNFLDLPPGPKYEDVLSGIREDYITVTLRRTVRPYLNRRMRTAINGLKISLKINSRGIEQMKSNEIVNFFYMDFGNGFLSDTFYLSTCSKNNVVHFTIKPPYDFEHPFAVELRVCSTGSDDNCVKKEHVFHDKFNWTFPDPLHQQKELRGEGISLFLCLKTYDPINPHCLLWDNRYISIEWDTCSFEKATSTDPVTFNAVKVITKDSASQTSVTSDKPDDSVTVLSKELMCLYQDQKYSDFRLKCDNVTFPVHKNILSARSPVLDRLLSCDMKESASSEVVIGDLDPSTLSLFLTFLYTGAIDEELQYERALKLYYAADKYQVPSLRKECAEFLCSNVSLSNVCEILSLADRHQDDMLSATSHKFLNTVLKSKWDKFGSGGSC